MKFNIKIVLFLSCLFLSSLWAKEKSWKEIGNMPIPVAGGEAIAYDGKIYIFGGFEHVDDAPISTVQVFDPNAPIGQQWDTVGDMEVPRSNFIARLYNNKVYISGGATGSSSQPESRRATLVNPRTAAITSSLFNRFNGNLQRLERG